MTLKEKFENTMISFLIDRNQDKSMLDHFEKLTDDYTIEFAEWFDEIRVERELLYDTRSIKQLLEIFKEEKGL